MFDELWSANHRLICRLRKEAAIEPARIARVLSQQNVATVEADGAFTDPSQYRLLADLLKEADQSSDTVGHVLVLDTPGGIARGAAYLAETIRDLVKPIAVHVRTELASAGAYVTAGADFIYAENEAAVFGSIGTLAVILDTSELAERMGVRVVVVSSGKFKAAGVPGTEFTDEQRAMLQQLIDDSQSLFDKALLQGRKLSSQQLSELKNARLYKAAEAMRLGLVDDIRSMADTVDVVRVTADSRGIRARAAGGTLADDAAWIGTLQALYREDMPEGSFARAELDAIKLRLVGEGMTDHQAAVTARKHFPGLCQAVEEQEAEQRDRDRDRDRQYQRKIDARSGIGM